MKTLVNFILILIVGCLVFSNTLHNSFHLDDLYIVLDNPGNQKLFPLLRHFFDASTISTLDRITQYRPLLPLSLSINYAIHGYSVEGYHIVNLSFHILSSLLVYLVCQELLKNWASFPASRVSPELVSLSAALLFVVHPVSGVVVNYICSRDLAMMRLFSIAAFYVYIKMRRNGITVISLIFSLFLFSLAMFSKTSAVGFPGTILLFELILAKESIKSVRPWILAFLYVAVVAFYYVFSKVYLNFSDFAQAVNPGITKLSYLLTQFKLHLFHYAKNFVYPFEMRPIPLIQLETSILNYQVLLGLFFVIATLCIAWRTRKTNPIYSFCILSYWSLMAPESSFVPLFYLVADYRPYPASTFLFIGISCATYQFLSKRIATALLVVFLGYIAAASYQINTYWRNEETLWTQSVKYGGEALAHMNLAMAINDRRDPRVKHELEEAIRIGPGFVLAYVNYGLLLMDLGDIEGGIKQIEKATNMAPSWAQPHYWLSVAYSRVGRLEEASHHSQIAASLDPKGLQSNYKAIEDLHKLGRYEASLSYIERVENVKSGYLDIRFYKAFTLQKLNRLDDAIKLYKSMIEDGDTRSQIYFNLAHALMTQGKCADAIPYFKLTLELQPDYQEAKEHLERCEGGTAKG